MSLNKEQGGLKSKIQEVLSAKPTITRIPVSPYKNEATFTLPYENSIIASLMYPFSWSIDNSIALHIDIFRVNENMRRQGIGTKLMKAATMDAIDHGATRLYGYISSESALRTRAKVFGKDNLQFFFSYPPGVFDEQLKWNFDEIVAEKFPPLYVVVDLTRVDTKGWK